MNLISVTVSVHGLHHWPDAPEHRNYLAHAHRHRFDITAYKKVDGLNREIEFHDLKDELHAVIHTIGIGTHGGLDFGARSCEHICQEVLKQMPELDGVETSEDGECAAFIKNEDPRVLKEVSASSIYVVTICGSTRFREEYEMAAYLLEELGIAVLTVGGYMHASRISFSVKQKKKLDQLHKDKILISDAILVLNRGGYIGDSTLSEIEFAKKHGKKIFYLERLRPDVRDVLDIHPDAHLQEDIWKGQVRLPFIIRKPLYDFACNMESQLGHKDYKGGWQKRENYPDLFNRLKEEVEELEDALQREIDSHIAHEAADVANFAMMIFDNARNQVKEEPHP